MRAKFLLMPVLSFMLISSNVVADDVFVDLSVLDALGETTSPVINNGPLFPIVKKTSPKKTVSKASKAKAKPVRKAKAVVKKTPVKKPVISEPTEETVVLESAEKVVIPAKSEVNVEVNTQEENRPFEDNEQANALSDDLTSSPFAIAPVEAAKEEISAAPIAPIEVETEVLTDAEKEPVIMEPLNGTTLLPVAEDNEPAVTAVPESLFSDSDTDLSVTDNIMLNTEDTLPTPLIEKNETSQIPAVMENISEVSNEINFEPNSYDLTEADKASLDSIVASFDNPAVNKIAIYAFNVDDGKDVFRRKRLSLNRAVEVRSYLLGKGYKNFSIKVINIDEADEKENKVIVEELK